MGRQSGLHLLAHPLLELPGGGVPGRLTAFRRDRGQAKPLASHNAADVPELPLVVVRN